MSTVLLVISIKRLEKVKPVLDEMFAYLESITVSSSCDLGKAVNYALNEKKYLYTFLENGDIPVDNNRAENAIRPFTVGRKNWDLGLLCTHRPKSYFCIKDVD